MIKISLHKWVDHYLAALSPIIGHCILPPCFRWFCNSFCAYVFDVDYIFVWFTEKDILEIFDTRCQMACCEDGMNLHPTRSIWAGLRRWRGFERGKWGDLEILSKEELAQEPVSCLFQSVKPGLAFNTPALHPVRRNGMKQKLPKEEVEFHCLRLRLHCLRIWMAPSC